MSAPTTPMEDGGGLPTPEQVATFLDAVAESPRVTLTQDGLTAQGRPIWVVTLGHPTPHAVPLRPLQIVATMHGYEPSPVESALRFIRDLAFSDTPETIDYLSHHTVVCHPLANPDGYVANTRDTSEGINLARTWFSLDGPETLAFRQAFSDVRPEVFVDCHEASAADIDEMLYNRAQNVTPDSEQKEYVDALIDGPITAANTAEGWTTDRYVGNARFLENLPRNGAALGFALAMVIEAPWEGNDRPLGMRVAGTLRTLEVVAEDHRVNADQITALRNAAIGRAYANAGTRGALTIRGESSNVTIDPGQAGYTLDAAAEAAFALYRDMFGITVLPVQAGGAFVYNVQTNYFNIAYLLDTDSTQQVADGVRAATIPPLDPFAGSAVMRDGNPYPLVGYVKKSGQLVPAT